MYMNSVASRLGRPDRKHRLSVRDERACVHVQTGGGPVVLKRVVTSFKPRVQHTVHVMLRNLGASETGDDPSLHSDPVPPVVVVLGGTRCTAVQTPWQLSASPMNAGDDILIHSATPCRSRPSVGVQNPLDGIALRLPHTIAAHASVLLDDKRVALIGGWSKPGLLRTITVVTLHYDVNASPELPQSPNSVGGVGVLDSRFSVTAEIVNPEKQALCRMLHSACIAFVQKQQLLIVFGGMTVHPGMESEGEAVNSLLSSHPAGFSDPGPQFAALGSSATNSMYVCNVLEMFEVRGNQFTHLDCTIENEENGPTPRCSSASCSLYGSGCSSSNTPGHGGVAIFGGRNERGEVLNDLFVLSPSGAASAGSNSSSGSTPSSPPFVWREITLTSDANCSVPRRIGHSLVTVVCGKILLVGGSGGSVRGNTTSPGASYTNAPHHDATPRERSADRRGMSAPISPRSCDSRVSGGSAGLPPNSAPPLCESWLFYEMDLEAGTISRLGGDRFAPTAGLVWLSACAANGVIWCWGGVAGTKSASHALQSCFPSIKYEIHDPDLHGKAAFTAAAVLIAVTAKLGGELSILSSDDDLISTDLLRGLDDDEKDAGHLPNISEDDVSTQTSWGGVLSDDNSLIATPTTRGGAPTASATIAFPAEQVSPSKASPALLQHFAKDDRRATTDTKRRKRKKKGGSASSSSGMSPTAPPGVSASISASEFPRMLSTSSSHSASDAVEGIHQISVVELPSPTVTPHEAVEQRSASPFFNTLQSLDPSNSLASIISGIPGAVRSASLVLSSSSDLDGEVESTKGAVGNNPHTASNSSTEMQAATRSVDTVVSEVGVNEVGGSEGGSGTPGKRPSVPGQFIKKTFEFLESVSPQMQFPVDALLSALQPESGKITEAATSSVPHITVREIAQNQQQTPIFATEVQAAESAVLPGTPPTQMMHQTNLNFGDRVLGCDTSRIEMGETGPAEAKESSATPGGASCDVSRAELTFEAGTSASSDYVRVGSVGTAEASEGVTVEGSGQGGIGNGSGLQGEGSGGGSGGGSYSQEQPRLTTETSQQQLYKASPIASEGSGNFAASVRVKAVFDDSTLSFTVKQDSSWEGFLDVLVENSMPLLSESGATGISSGSDLLQSTRLYWIDEDQDRITLGSAVHYQSFMEHCGDRNGRAAGRVAVEWRKGMHPHTQHTTPTPPRDQPNPAYRTTPPRQHFPPNDTNDIDNLVDASRIRWREGRLIGKGSYGEVYQALEASGRIIAVKKIPLPDGQIGNVEREISLLRDLDHPNIVKLLGTDRLPHSNCLCILMEYLSGGSLASMARQYGGDGGGLSLGTVQVYTRQILLGLEYLHGKEVVHRDIKGENILVDQNGNCKLGDFGASKIISETSSAAQISSGLRGTILFFAPEIISDMQYSFQSDIWALGCTFIEMVTGAPPWNEWLKETRPNQWIIHKHVEANPTPPLPTNVPESFMEMLLQCLQVNVEMRPSAAQLLHHRFLKGVFDHGPTKANSDLFLGSPSEFSTLQMATISTAPPTHKTS